MSEQKKDRERTAEARLADLGRRIDEVRRSAREDRERVDRSLDRRLDGVRAKNAEFRSELRRIEQEEDEAWDEAFGELDRDLDQLDAEIDVLEAQLAAQMAADWEEYQRAAEEELAAYDRFLNSVDERVTRAAEDVREHHKAAIAHARGKMQAAKDAMDRARANGAQKTAAAREDMRTATAEVDSAVIEAVADLEVALTTAGTSDRQR
jgi:hypothetical protein